MIGRGIFGNPWLFSKTRKIEDIVIEEKLAVMIEHTKLFMELLGDIKSFALMKKHYKAYVNGFDGAKELRVQLMESETVEQIEKIVRLFLQK
jgi:tRNA-dihydrouridine synthase